MYFFHLRGCFAYPQSVELWLESCQTATCAAITKHLLRLPQYPPRTAMAIAHVANRTHTDENTRSWLHLLDPYEVPLYILRQAIRRLSATAFHAVLMLY